MDDVDQSSVPGSCPKFGAIFMSNNATKKESLRRKIFALPYSQSHFVKQVKDGMILFLFEFEKRELHGVFQACSDGAMNILPYVFSSSGKQFPAQVWVHLFLFCVLCASSLPQRRRMGMDAFLELVLILTEFHTGKIHHYVVLSSSF